MKQLQTVGKKAQWNAGVGAAVGLLLGSGFADLVAPGSSLIGLLGLFAGAAIGAIFGHRYATNGSNCE